MAISWTKASQSPEDKPQLCHVGSREVMQSLRVSGASFLHVRNEDIYFRDYCADYFREQHLGYLE